MTSTTPHTVDELIRRIQIGWAELEHLVSPLSESQLITPGPPDGWAVKDHLIHIAEWERATTAVLRHRPHAEGFGLTELPNDVDGLNAFLYERSRGMALDEVFEQGRKAHAEVLAAIHHLTDDDLGKTRAEYGPEPELTDRTIIEKIVGDTYGHYADHVVWIGDLLRVIQ